MLCLNRRIRGSLLIQHGPDTLTITVVSIAAEPQLSAKMLGIKKAFDSCTATLQSKTLRDKHNGPEGDCQGEESQQVEAWHQATVERIRAARGENSNA